MLCPVTPQAATKLILFDIDATLLSTGGAGMRAMARAGKELFGEKLSWDGIEPSGGLDPLLFQEAAERSGLSVRPEDHDAFRELYEVLLKDELERGKSGVRALPGVHEVLSILRGQRNVVLGLLTGNYAQTARWKLRAADIEKVWFSIGAFGADAGSRPGLVEIALHRYAKQFGEPIRPGRVVVVGDTPRDMSSACLNGCTAFGVATGKYSVEDLKTAGAHVAVENLLNPDPLLRLLEDG